MNKLIAISLLILVGALSAGATEFRHIGDFIIQSRIKVTKGRTVPISIKPLRLSAYTDGISVRISTKGNVDKASEYRIYRSDGIGIQRTTGGPLEVIPGVQAVSEKGNVLRQLRLTGESLTITAFPGVSDQTIVTSATVAPPPKAIPADPKTAATTDS